MFNDSNKKIKEISEMSIKYIDNLKMVDCLEKATHHATIGLHIRDADGTTLCYAVEPNDGELVKLITKFIKQENEKIKKLLIIRN